MNSPLPTLNAFLNGTSAILLVVGVMLIHRGHREAHARVMLAATAVSAAFLASYLYYHFVVVPRDGHTPFGGEGWLKKAYLGLLVTHVLGAIVNLPMILRTLWLAHREDWARHRYWARRTFPLWLYVSVTGVVVYLALYVFNPAGAS